MRVPFQFLLAAILAALLTGCGFQLRGTLSGNLPYKTMMIALPDTSEVRVWLERYINAAGTTEIIDDPKLADATFQQLSDSRIKTILSVNAQGRVREYRLQLNYRFHSKAFANIQEMLNPKNNIEYAAKLLIRLKKQHGTWYAAICNYHSSKPDHQRKYSYKVVMKWGQKYA